MSEGWDTGFSSRFGISEILRISPQIYWYIRTYSVEATKEPDFFGFYSPDLPGFSGLGHSVEDCLYKAKWGMVEHVNLLREQGLPVPPKNVNPKIIIQNEKTLKAA